MSNNKVEEKLVNGLIMNKIYFSKVKTLRENIFQQVGNKKIDLTNNAIACVFQWFINELESKDNKAVNNYSITYPKSKYTLWMLPTKKYKKILEQNTTK